MKWKGFPTKTPTKGTVKYLFPKLGVYSDNLDLYSDMLEFPPI